MFLKALFVFYILYAFVLTLLCVFVLALTVLHKKYDHISWGRERKWALICDHGASLDFLLTIFCVFCMGLTDVTITFEPRDHGTYHISDQRRLRRVCVLAQSHQSFVCCLTRNLEVNEGSGQHSDI